MKYTYKVPRERHVRTRLRTITACSILNISKRLRQHYVLLMKNNCIVLLKRYWSKPGEMGGVC